MEEAQRAPPAAYSVVHGLQSDQHSGRTQRAEHQHHHHGSRRGREHLSQHREAGDSSFSPKPTKTKHLYPHSSGLITAMLTIFARLLLWNAGYRHNLHTNGRLNR